MICPLKKLEPIQPGEVVKDGYYECDTSRCAWWSDYCACCTLTAINKLLYDVKLLMERRP
jgi:hypothetical protein